MNLILFIYLCRVLLLTALISELYVFNYHIADIIEGIYI